MLFRSHGLLARSTEKRYFELYFELDALVRTVLEVRLALLAEAEAHDGPPRLVRLCILGQELVKQDFIYDEPDVDLAEKRSDARARELNRVVALLVRARSQTRKAEKGIKGARLHRRCGGD